MSAVDLHMEAPDGGLKELVLRWFTETQAPHVLNNGSFPDWFQGFAARKDTEDLLSDKALGCFLIRLSDKAIGYILSYKGLDRCRHFVITQNPDGQFGVSGDCQTHGSLAALIEHYKVSPIQPFGEYLTSSCYEEDAGELYDVVTHNATGKTGVSVQALRNLWDQKQDRHGNDPGNKRGIQPQSDAAMVQPPALPLKSQNRKLTVTVSVDTVSLSQGVPPLPKRGGIPQGFAQSGSLPDTAPHSGEAETNANQSERLWRNTTPTEPTSTSNSFDAADASHPGDLCPPEVMYSELRQVESRSPSLPRLDSNTEEQEEEEQEEEEEEEYSNQLSRPPFSTASIPATPGKRVTCHTYSLHDPRDGSGSSWSEHQGGAVGMSRSNPLYKPAQGPGGSSAQPGDSMYAEVLQRPTPTGLPENTYEQLPGEAAAAQGNTYELLEDVKTQKSKYTWGTNNVKWKKFLPDYKKK